MADSSRCLRRKFFRAPEIFEMEEMGLGAGMAGTKKLNWLMVFTMKYTLIIFSAFFCLSVLGAGKPSSYDAKEYWPGWLGPQRNGWVEGFKPPKVWPKELKRVWSAKVGAGYGTPLVANGRVYLHARQGEDEVVWCLNLKTGTVKWRKSYRTPFKMGGGGEGHGKGPKSSPVIADGRVFAMSITGMLSAWDADTGQLLWRKDYGKRFGKPHPYWGTSGSPVVDGDRVIAHFGNDKAGALMALDVKTGRELWSHGKDGTCYSSPRVVEHEGVRQVIEWNHRALVGVESWTGKLLWEYPFPHLTHNQNMPTPTYHKGQILLGGENRGVHGLAPQLKDGKWTVQHQWSQRGVALDMSSAVMNDGLLYGFSHFGRGRLFCLDPKDGKILWEGPARTGNNVMFLSCPGHVLALINTGELRVVKAQRNRYETAASWRVALGGTWAPPVLLQNGLLTKDTETLTFWAFK